VQFWNHCPLTLKAQDARTPIIEPPHRFACDEFSPVTLIVGKSPRNLERENDFKGNAAYEAIPKMFSLCHHYRATKRFFDRSIL
jgi:hypothetical protein